MADVTLSHGNMDAISSGIRYIDMNASNGGVNRATSIRLSDGEVDLFSRNFCGMFYGFNLTLQDMITDWYLKIYIDNINILEGNNPSLGFPTLDLEESNLYGIDNNRNSGFTLGFMLENNTIRFMGIDGNPIRINQSLRISVSRTSNANRRFRAGFVTLVEE